MRLLITLLLSLCCSVVWGQITVPAEIERDVPIVATVAAPMPDGATFDGGWKSDEGVSILPSGDKGTVHIWAKPGTHTLRFSGFWLHLKEITFTDGAGEEITITSYLGHGFIDETAEFKVKGGDDGPDPIPGGPFQLMFFYDADQLDDYPPSQRQLLTSLVVRKNLEESGHNVVEILEKSAVDAAVVAKYPVWINAVKGDPLPRVAIAPKDGGPVADFQLPSSYEALEALLKDPALAGYFKVSRRVKQ